MITDRREFLKKLAFGAVAVSLGIKTKAEQYPHGLPVPSGTVLVPPSTDNSWKAWGDLPKGLSLEDLTEDQRRECQRLLDWIGETIEKTLEPYKDEPLNSHQIDMLVAEIDRYIDLLIPGTYTVTFDPGDCDYQITFDMEKLNTFLGDIGLKA